MLCADGLFLQLVTDVVALAGDEVDELGAAVEDELPRVVGDPDVGQQFLDHLVHGGPGDGELVILVLVTVPLGAQLGLHLPWYRLSLQIVSEYKV